MKSEGEGAGDSQNDNEESSTEISNRVASSTNSNNIRAMNSTLGVEDLYNERLRTRRLEGFFYERRCCKEGKVCDHTRHRRRVKLKKAPQQKVDFSEDVKEIRRRQFFNFFADFYTKNSVLQDSDEEKSGALKDIFKRFYTADTNMPKVKI